MGNRELRAELQGLVIVNKCEGLSSQAVVNRVKRIFGAAKAGHTGTLDPMATGVLPVLLGRAVKASEFMLTGDKHYGAVLTLGITTDTEDVTGEVLTRFDGTLPSEEEVGAAVLSMVGTQLQTPPMYSALKVGGKKLCDLAREGVTIDREAREITVYSIDCKKLSDTDYFLDIRCSKGTYIRTLCADIGKKLGTGGAMKALTRLSASGFGIAEAHTLDELEGMSSEELLASVIDTEEIFRTLPELTLSPFFSRLARAGQGIYLRKIGKSFAVGERVRLSDDTGFFAVGEVREFEDGAAIKPIRQF